MSTSSVCRKFLEVFACSHVNDGFMEDNGARMLGCFMNNLQGSPLLEVKELKDKGNSFFRQNHFDRAAAFYDEACKLLSLSIGVNGGDDVQSVSVIAISLNSNLAACALKLEEYQAALDLCSMILDTFPHNVKALFRRAMAFMKLKRFSEAELDLNEALVVEPRNKDVLREIAVVKGHLLMKENGKRALEAADVVNVNINSKKHVHDGSFQGFKDVRDIENENIELSDDLSNRGGESDMRKDGNEKITMEVTENSSCGMDLSTGSKKIDHGSTKSLLEFSKRNGGNSRMKIPRQSYQKLLEGKELSFYHKRDLSTTTIRIFNIETATKRDTIKEKCKKKRRRRRRRPKRRNSNTMVDLKKDMTQLDFTEVESVVPCVNLNASSLCENLLSSDSQILQVSSKSVAHDSSLSLSPLVDNAMLIRHKVQNSSTDHQPPSFSTSPQECKMFSFSFDKFRCGHSMPLFRSYPIKHSAKEEKKRRRITPKKIYSQRDESPRHILSTCTPSRSFSHKFLRLRGVSVSCRRYSPEAKLTKKRKEIAHLASSDRPLKKPALVLSLFSYLNNVIIKSDSESRVCIV